jgi:hypothetical protein
LFEEDDPQRETGRCKRQVIAVLPILMGGGFRFTVLLSTYKEIIVIKEFHTKEGN